MQIKINGTVIRGDLIESIEYRSDLVVIPESIVAVIRFDKEIYPKFKEGVSFESGYDSNQYQIIKVEPFFQPIGMSGDTPLGVFRVIAVLKSFVKLMYIRKTAVVKDKSSLGVLFKACGFSGNLGADISCERFSCFVGDYPSIRLQRVMQTEASSPLWNGKELGFYRNADLLKQEPVYYFESNTTSDIESGFLERHQVAENFSTEGDKAKTISGGTGKARIVEFKPRVKTRNLLNSSKVFINKKVLRTSYDARYKAGNVMEIAGKPFVILTALHARTQNQEYSKFWLGSS